MKVNNTLQGSIEKTGNTGGTAKTNSTGKSSDSKVQGDAKSGASENISISPRAREAALAKEMASQASDVNEEKVAKLRDAISKGAYKVDADKIADRLFDDHINNSI